MKQLLPGQQVVLFKKTLIGETGSVAHPFIVRHEEDGMITVISNMPVGIKNCGEDQEYVVTYTPLEGEKNNEK